MGSDPEDILDAMFTVAQERRDGKLNDDEVSVIKEFYWPFCLVIAELQQDMRDVLDATRLDYAEGVSLDLICQLIGVTRNPAEKADGSQRFYFDSAKSEDTYIQSGTVVQTEGTPSTRFETTEDGTIAAGDTEVYLNIEAVEGGTDGNVGPGSVTEWGTDQPNPELKTNNPDSITGGRDEEEDENLRERAKRELSEGSKATAPAILRALRSLPETESVTLFVNDTDTDGKYNLPSRTIEPVVDYNGDSQDVFDALRDVKAAAEPIVTGVNGTEVSGTTKLDNGQEFNMSYSEPNPVEIYIDADLTYVQEDYTGDNDVIDSIVEYIGGYKSDGELVKTGLGTGDDVIYGEIEYAIRQIPGVYDINSLTVGTTDDPTGTSNVSISLAEVASTDGRSDKPHIGITSNPR